MKRPEVEESPEVSRYKDGTLVTEIVRNRDFLHISNYTVSVKAKEVLTMRVCAYILSKIEVFVLLNGLVSGLYL